METQENIYPFDVNELYYFIEKALTDKSFHGEFLFGFLNENINIQINEILYRRSLINFAITT